MRSGKKIRNESKTGRQVAVGEVLNDLTENLRAYLSALQAVTPKKVVSEK